MFKSKIYALTFLLLITFQIARSQDASAVDETVNLRNEALKLYGQKNYGEALKLVRQIVQLKEQKFGSEHIEVAKALADVATIEIAGGDEKSGEMTARKAIAIFEAKQFSNLNDVLAFARVFEAIGFIKFKNEKPEEAIAEYSRALKLKEEYIGQGSLEVSKTLWQIGNSYIMMNKYQEAFEAFERVVEIRSVYVEDIGYDELSSAIERYECAAGKSYNNQKADLLIQATEGKVKKYRKQAVVDGGVVNGKALKLVKPRYPNLARAVKATGTVGVKVTIDETGKIIFACAKSGHPLLLAAAEQAALDSKFAPTQINGRPVKVTGFIVYNFRP